MKKRLLDFLSCSKCGNRFDLVSVLSDKEEVLSGFLKCSCGKQHPITNGIPRFVKNDSYLDSFSLEWNIHQKTQLDSYSGMPVSEGQMQNRLSNGINNLRGKLVLDAGCGIGRFAEIAAKYGAEVVCVDLSYSVEIAYRNIGKLPNIHIIQADILDMPFKDSIFDLIYSFGVLHHTPDARRAFGSIPKFLKQSGELSIFVYASYSKAIVYSSAFWRVITTRIPKRLLYCLSYVSVPLYFLYKIPVIGMVGKALLPIPMINNWKWRVLDTFDWYSPKYQSKHTHWEVFDWFEENGIKDIRIYPGEVTMSGFKR